MTRGSVIATRLRDAFRADWIVIVVLIVIGLAPLLWLGPMDQFIHGQDAYSFVNPFTYNANPLAQYSYLYSHAIGIPASQAQFYVMASLYLLNRISPSPVIAERLLFLSGFLVAAAGVFFLFSTINVINGRKHSRDLIPKCAATVFYLMNPFSLSITWWHAQGWTPFYIILPYLFGAGLLVIYQRLLPIRSIGVTIVVGVLLGAGATGPFAVVVAYLVAVFLAVILLKLLLGQITTRLAVVKGVALAVLGLAWTGWTVIPYLLMTDFSPVPSSPGGFPSLTALFQVQSATTQLLPTLRLVAFRWISLVPNAYPWAVGDPAIVVASWLVPAAVLLGALQIRRVRGLGLIYALLISAVFVSIGANPPFGGVNAWLLERGGPFAILANPYYFIGQVYVVGAAVATFVIAQSATSELAEVLYPSNALARPNYSDVGGSRPRWFPRRWERGGVPRQPTDPPIESRASRCDSWHFGCGGRRQSIANRHHHALPGRVYPGLAIGLVVVLVVSSSIPFVTGNVYQTQGSNIDRFVIPNSFPLLKQFFDSSITSLSYYVMVLPMSTIQARYVRIDNQSYADSGVLIANYVPYPLIWGNISEQTAAIANAVQTGSPSNLGLLLSALHIRYVVMDPFVDFGSYFMNHTPSGEPINFTQLYSNMVSSLGAPARVGAFDVFTCNAATPIVTVGTNPTELLSPTTAAYVDFLSRISSTNSTFTEMVRRSLWTTNATSATNWIAPYPVGSGGGTWDFPPTASVDIIDAQGNPVNARNLADNSSSGVRLNEPARTVTLFDPLLVSLNSTNRIRTNFMVSNGIYSSGSNGESFLAYNQSIPSGIRIGLEFRVGKLSPQNWLNIDMTDRNITVRVQLYFDPHASDYNLGMVAYNRGQPYAWNNYPIPPTLLVSDLTLNLTVGRTGLATSHLSANGSSDIVRGTLWFSGLGNVTKNQGFNASAALTAAVDGGRYVLILTTINLPILVSVFSVYRNPGFQYVVVVNVNEPSNDVRATVTEQFNGDMIVTFRPIPGVDTYYVELGFPSSPLWLGSASVGTVHKAFGSPLSNVYFLKLPSNVTTSSVVVTLQFVVHLNDGLYVSFVEVAVGAVLALAPVGLWTRRKSSRKKVEGQNTRSLLGAIVGTIDGVFATDRFHFGRRLRRPVSHAQILNYYEANPKGCEREDTQQVRERYALVGSLIGRETDIIDVGCGAGDSIAFLSLDQTHYVGVDISNTALSLARHRFPRATFVRASATQLPLKDYSAKTLISLETLEHLLNPDDLLREARRTLVPGGRLLISTPNRLNYALLVQAFAKRLIHLKDLQVHDQPRTLRWIEKSMSVEGLQVRFAGSAYMNFLRFFPAHLKLTLARIALKMDQANLPMGLYLVVMATKPQEP